VPPFLLAFLDCEFGGLDPELHDITEIALILTDYRLMELDSRAWKVRARPERVSAEAAAISGYDAAVWEAEAVPVHQALAELVEMLPRGKTVLPAGQNVRMDVLFLERAFKACEIPYPFDYHVVDLVTLYYSWSLIAGETLSALSLRNSATAAGLATGSVPHRALGDARLTLETFRHYLGRLAPRRRSEEDVEVPLAFPENLEA
jgi:oligoribonuclease (3'-5' exoribonuclease)